MPSPASYLLLSPSKPFHRLQTPRVPRRLHVVTCAAPRGSSGGSGRREVIPAGASKAKKQIVFFDAAPPVSQVVAGGGDGEEGKKETAVKPAAAGRNPVLSLVKRTTKRTLSVLSNLPLAISEMFAIAGLMALGTARTNSLP
jgi:cytochrome c biogenesis protein